MAWIRSRFGTVRTFCRIAVELIGGLLIGQAMIRIQTIATIFKDFTAVYRIPADLDDSSVNLVRKLPGETARLRSYVLLQALGGMLSAQRNRFPLAYKKWETANSNITALFEIINKVRLRS